MIICGDREWSNGSDIRDIITKFNPDVVIEGEARGADTLARLSAESLGIQVEKYPVDWGTYGLAAGPIRNSQMLIEGKPDICVAFHNNIKVSKGTRHMVGIASKANIPTFLFSNGELKEYKGE